MTNLQLAIKHLDGIGIKPGEYFSLWKLVGRLTKAKGYLEGFETGTRGGLCQLGNLLFWIFVHSPLSVKERYGYGFDVFPDVNRKVPFGERATLSYNYIDLQVRNETDNSFVIKLWMDKTHLYGEILSRQKLESLYRIEERNYQINHQYWGGYTRHNQIYKIANSGGVETEELLVENHAIMMYDPFLECGK